MGGDRLEWMLDNWFGVSIHAPAWGATILFISLSSLLNVSIHAPAWGATFNLALSYLSAMFQSTPPHGGRRNIKEVAKMYLVSIHAPAWGATQNN